MLISNFTIFVKYISSECTADTHCSKKKPICETSSNQCVGKCYFFSFLYSYAVNKNYS